MSKPAFWGSWADCFPMMRERHLAIVHVNAFSPILRAVGAAAREIGRREGFEVPTWELWHTDSDFHEAASRVESVEPEQAFFSCSGPLAGIVLSVAPSITLTRIESHLFRVVLLRRFRFPLPLSVRQCRCGRSLDVFACHRAACARAGVGVGKEGFCCGECRGSNMSRSRWQSQEARLLGVATRTGFGAANSVSGSSSDAHHCCSALVNSANDCTALRCAPLLAIARARSPRGRFAPDRPAARRSRPSMEEVQGKPQCATSRCYGASPIIGPPQNCFGAQKEFSVNFALTTSLSSWEGNSRFCATRNAGELHLRTAFATGLPRSRCTIDARPRWSTRMLCPSTQTPPSPASLLNIPLATKTKDWQMSPREPADREMRVVSSVQSGIRHRECRQQEA